MNGNLAKKLIERLRTENEQWLSQTKEASMDGIFFIIERVKVEKKKDFILELIQNADDCNSSKISFNLASSKILIQNNGDPFKRDNVVAICKLGKSTKGSGKIGFMGFGFRAVFEVSKNPEIYSNNFSFSFENLIIPHWIQHIPQNIKTRLSRMKERGSIFVLPNLSKEIHYEVKQELGRLSPTLLLYLQKLKRIKIGKETLQMDPGPFPSSFWISKGREERHLWKRYFSVRLPIPKELKEFLRKDRNLDKIGKEPKEYEQISITYETTQNGKIADKEYGGLYAFLPLANEKNTGFRFNIQADFSVDAARRNLQEPESSWNQWILANVYYCFPPLLKDYRDQRNVRTEFYRILPLDDPERPRYLNIVKEKIDEYIRKEDSILVKVRKSRRHPDRRGWVKPKYAVIADSELQKLFDNTDLKHLFGGRKFYVADDEIENDGMIYVEEIVDDKLSLNETLRLLKDPRWVFNRKIKGIRKPEKWIGDLIIYFANKLEKKLEGKSRWDGDYEYEKHKFLNELSNVKFLLTEQGKLSKPQKIFLPSPENIDIPKHLWKKYNIVNRKLVHYLEGKRIKSEMEKRRREKGLNLLHDTASELSPETIVTDIINPAFSGDHWKKYSDSTLRKYTDFIKKHENCWEKANIRLRVQTGDKKRNYKDPDELYLGSKYANEFDLDTLYRGYEYDNFVSLDYIHKFIESKSERAKQQINSWKKFLTRIGVREIPKIRKHEKEYVLKEEVEKELAYPEDKVRGTYYTATYPGYARRDCDFDNGLKEILSYCLNDKIEGSCKRLRILMRILDRRWNYYSQYLEAQYGWHEYNQLGRTYERLGASSFAKFLRDSNWVPTKDGKHLKPEAVALSELKDIVKAPVIDYEMSNEKFKKYLQDLGLQTKPTVEGAIALLKTCVEQKVNEINRFREIYGYLAQHEKEKKKIREELANFSCIFVPNRRKRYWKTSDIFWEGGNSFLEWKTDVGQTYPKLKDFFLDVLGVKEKPNHEDYVEFLQSYLWKKEELTNKEKSSLGNVYHHLNYIVTTPELKKSETWISLKKSFRIWCVDDYWLEIDENIFYNDDEELYKLFRKHKDLIFAYIPKIPKNLEVKQLFTELGVRSLSESYLEKCSVSGEQIVAKEEFQKRIRRISKYIAHFVKKRSPKTFARLNKAGAFSLLGKIEIKFAENIKVSAVADGYAVSLGTRRSFYSWKNLEVCLYLERSLQGNDSSCFRHIGIALANAFEKGIGLETFVPYISGMDKTEIEQAMQDYRIPTDQELKIEKPQKEPFVPEKGKPTIGAEKLVEVSRPVDIEEVKEPKVSPADLPIETPPPEVPPPETPLIQTSPPETSSLEGASPEVSPPETPLSERVTVITQKQIRDSRPAIWVKTSYNYHCQICLSREKPEVLTYSKSYAGRKANRKSIIKAHHIKEVARDKGHDHPGNYLSLCHYHHVLIHGLNLSLDDLKSSLSNIAEKEIVWPNGETVRWKVITLDNEFVEGNRAIQIVIHQKHVEKLKEYIDLVAPHVNSVTE